ncbi:hypothetical protein HAP41_0000003565 [Bradyrhizobium barranii subsp. apii]|uniref:Uncharacterized protein n=1 Tax=Bradyrhizobium barranii subsp. apii TaxID=2819348 RepID=A0A8T5UTI5_9BRAD|nr:hypothetical protein [Bradyrhizobium barranii]UPT88235.1 hypothetical protein HAP41_0000003565 [Bradyrhizobium barranii subsp. apii]
MRLYGRLFKRNNPGGVNNLVTEFFDGSAERKTELARATLAITICLHEAGHALMAELHHLDIEWINLPRLDALLSCPRPTEIKDKSFKPAVSIPPAGSRLAVPYLLGGLFGELNAYDDDALANPTIPQVSTYGCIGDFDELWNRVANDCNATNEHRSIAANLRRAIFASRDGAERNVFLEHFDFQPLPEFRQFRQHRARHRSIAEQLYQRWKASHFERYNELSPSFGAYRY